MISYSYIHLNIYDICLNPDPYKHRVKTHSSPVLTTLFDPFWTLFPRASRPWYECLVAAVTKKSPTGQLTATKTQCLTGLESRIPNPLSAKPASPRSSSGGPCLTPSQYHQSLGTADNAMPGSLSLPRLVRWDERK